MRNIGIPGPALALLGTALGLALAPPPAQGQGIRQMATACGGESEVLTAWCHEAALAVQGAQALFGLSASGGSDTPGSASTVGWRLKGSPRMVLAARGGLARGTIPNLRARGASALPGGKTALTPASGHLLAAVGIFDGFSLAPSAGGLLSIDLAGSYHTISAPGDEGFDGRVQGWGAGVRLGILRESFTLPGITLSASRRWLGRIRHGDRTAGDPTESEFEISASSLRAVVGKDLFGLGLFGGVGWDRYGGEVEILAADPTPGLPSPATGRATGDPTSERRLVFLGGGMTFVILQVSAEIGWADGFDIELPERSASGYDPASRSYFGSLAFRLTF